MSTATAKASRWECTSEEYHADSANSVSHSELECFAQSPRLYEGRYLTGEFPREESAALDLGIVLHAELLEDKRKHELIPDSVLSASGARQGNAWKDFANANVGKILLKASEYEPVLRMRESIERHEAARRLLFDAAGQIEYSIRFECPITGIQRRARLDKLLGNVIVDLKSCRDASPKAFSRHAFEYAYHRQCAFYQDAIEALTGERHPFVFVAIEKTPPFSCEVYELKEDFVALGRLDNERLLRRFAQCRESGVWLRERHGEIHELSAPVWAFNETEWEIR